jgi:hypothetical protein
MASRLVHIEDIIDANAPFIRTVGYMADVVLDRPFILLSSGRCEDVGLKCLLVDIYLMNESFYCDMSGKQLKPFSTHAKIGEQWMIFGELEELDNAECLCSDETKKFTILPFILRAHIMTRLDQGFNPRFYKDMISMV